MLVFPKPTAHPLREEIRQRRIRLWELGKMVGYSPSSLSDWLNGVRAIPPHIEEKLSRIIGEGRAT